MMTEKEIRKWIIDLLEKNTAFTIVDMNKEAVTSIYNNMIAIKALHIVLGDLEKDAL
jgi:hypothetical protein